MVHRFTENHLTSSTDCVSLCNMTTAQPSALAGSGRVDVAANRYTPNTAQAHANPTTFHPEGNNVNKPAGTHASTSGDRGTQY